MEEQTRGEKNPDSWAAKRKQRCRNSSSAGSYEKDMNKFLTIIYHNINRLHEEKTPIRKSSSEPDQLELCGTQEQPLMENSVHRFGGRHSDFALHLSQSERSNCPKDSNRKVAFADTSTEKSRKSFSEPHQQELYGTQEPPFMENSVSGIRRFGRRHSDFALRWSQLERSNCPKDSNRKVAFADTLTEKSRKSCSGPHQQELCGTQKPPFMDDSVSGIHRFGRRRHSDFALRLSQLERSNSPKDFKRKVADSLTEESNFPF